MFFSSPFFSLVYKFFFLSLSSFSLFQCMYFFSFEHGALEIHVYFLFGVFYFYFCHIICLFFPLRPRNIFFSSFIVNGKLKQVACCFQFRVFVCVFFFLPPLNFYFFPLRFHVIIFPRGLFFSARQGAPLMSTVPRSTCLSSVFSLIYFASSFLVTFYIF